ncbi:LacI family DNA-binding transcriptional regulator [Arvimicrobium flavum]|uniref:LacI family DNA-binding transcriptional regulator n=1 Tax=Arvimicrobium flavum TaxID=3393320 RepID=UPI00237A3254|nr:LacI family DNA-binding transcriptional regulator [Mesorhizobium shangrilense]
MTGDSQTTRGTGRITLQHIAEAAGVSRATVSLVMRDNPAIPKRTKVLVLEKADQLGYIYNRSAASLRTHSTRTVGLVVHDITNPYFAEIVAGIQQSLSQISFVAFLGDSGDCPDRQMAFLNLMQEYNVDGILMSPAAGTNREHLRQKLKLWRLPCVFYSRHLDAPEFDYVGCDNVSDMRRLTGGLLGAGHRRIAFVGVNETISSGRERLEGYVAALDLAGIALAPELLVSCPSTRPDGYQAVQRLLQLPDPPTAIACFNDVLAFGVMLAIQNAGLRVGEDVAVTGFDDVVEASLWRPALTSNHVATDEIGREAVQLLVERMRNYDAPPVRHLINGTLQARGSARIATGSPVP